MPKSNESMFLAETPIEEYQVQGKTIYVKREDMFGQYPAPPLAKLRGARHLLQGLAKLGVKRVGVFDTRISKAGQGVACICRELGLECWAGFPKLKNTSISESHLIAQEQGAKLFPLKAGRTAVLYSQFKKFVEENKGFMLPLGLVCHDTVHAVESISAAMKNKFNSIVLSAGTGTIATGVARGTMAKVYGVSCGMSIEKQWKRIQALSPDKFLWNLILIPPAYDYYDKLDTGSCPFPTSPYYDMKAWVWLEKNIDKVEKPICFWNIGV